MKNLFLAFVNSQSPFQIQLESVSFRLPPALVNKTQSKETEPPPPLGKVSKKEDTVIYPKQKLLVYIRRLRNMFWNKLRPKNHLLGVKKSWNPFNPRLI